MTPGRRRAALWGAAAVLLGVAAFVVAFYVLGPGPPEVALAGVGPGAAEDIAEARSAVNSWPFLGSAWGNLGAVLHHDQFMPEAETCYARAERLEPWNPRWPYLRGVLRLNTDVEAALPFLERSVRLGGGVATPRQVYGETLLVLGRLDEAEAQFKAAGGNDARSLVGLGRVALRRGDLMAARRALEPAVKAAPRARSARALLAEVYQRAGDVAKAEEQRKLATTIPDAPWPDPYLRATLSEPRGEDAAVALSTALLESGRRDEALGLLLAAVGKAPNSAKLRRALGRAYFRMDRNAEAEAAYREAVRLNPESVESQFEWGLALETLRKYNDAAGCFRRAAELKPADGASYLHLGRCLEATGDEAGAVVAYQAAVRYRPDSAAAHEALGTFLALGRRDREAADALERALALDPTLAAARRHLEIVRARLGAGPAGND